MTSSDGAPKQADEEFLPDGAMAHNASVATTPATAPHAFEGAQEAGLPATQYSLEETAVVGPGSGEGSEEAMLGPSPEAPNQEEVVERVVVEEKVSTVVSESGTENTCA